MESANALNRLTRRYQHRSIKRLAIVTESYPPEINGAGHSLRGLIHALAKRGYQIQLTRVQNARRPQPAPPAGVEEVPVPRLPMLRYNGIPLGRPARTRLLSGWQRFAPEAVFVATEGPLGHTALNLAGELGIPVFTAFHSGFHHCGKQGALQFLHADMAIYLRRFHARSAATVVPNPELTRELRERGYTHLRTIPIGVETALFHPHRRSLPLRARWGLADGALGLLYVGRTHACAGFDLALETFRRIQQQRPDARLIVVGDGWGLHRMGEKYRDVSFCGLRSGEDLAMHYASADILLAPCTRSTCAAAVLEGMASGLGVIAYDQGAARMHLRNKRSGLLARRGDRADFVRCALELASAPDPLNYLRVHARTEAEKRDWQHLVFAYEALFQDLEQHEPLASLAS